MLPHQHYKVKSRSHYININKSLKSYQEMIRYHFPFPVPALEKKEFKNNSGMLLTLYG